MITLLQVHYRAACDPQFYTFYLGRMDRRYDWMSQFLFNCASLMTKMAVKNKAIWRDLSKQVGQLYLAAWAGEVRRC